MRTRRTSRKSKRIKEATCSFCLRRLPRGEVTLYQHGAVKCCTRCHPGRTSHLETLDAQVRCYARRIFTLAADHEHPRRRLVEEAFAEFHAAMLAAIAPPECGPEV